MMKNLKLLNDKLLIGVLSFVILFSACKKEDAPLLTNPSLSIENGNTIKVKRGEAIDVTFNLSAEGGNRELLVYQNAGLLEVIPLSKEASSYTYSNLVVPMEAKEGEEFEYEFSLVNVQNTESPRVGLTVSTIAYDPITIGSEVLYKVDIPEDGIVESDYNFVSGRNYYINSTMDFQDGTVLTIEEDVNIYVKANSDPLIDIIIRPGAELSINGTATNPVTVTSEKELLEEDSMPGDWGVFNIRGDGNGTNSGTVQYLRLEYGSARNFRLQNVGSGTTIQYVQVYKANGEGIMPTGGDVNLKYIIATDCVGGGFRIGDDYSGNLQFGIAAISQTHADNSEVEIRETASPTISNFTVVGPGVDKANTTGIRLRATSSGKIYNSIIASFPRRGLRLNDEVVVTDLLGPTVFAYSYIFDVATDPFRDDTDNGNPFQGYKDTEGIYHNPFFNNVTDLNGKNPVLLSIPGIETNSFVPDATQESEFNPTTLDAFFTSADFVGAIKDASNDWTIGWSKNSDGTLRN